MPGVRHSQRPPLPVPAGCDLALPVPRGLLAGAIVTAMIHSAQWEPVRISPCLATFLLSQGTEVPGAPIGHLPTPPLAIPRPLPFGPSLRTPPPASPGAPPLPALPLLRPGSRRSSARPAHGVWVWGGRASPAVLCSGLAQSSACCSVPP